MTAEHPKLTARQRQVLQLIERAIQRNGAPPTRAEIAAELGFRSANAAEEHLRALARKGVIDLVSGTARGIRLKSAGRGTGRLRHDTRALPGMEQLVLPLIGRVAAGSPILAEAHIAGTYTVARSLFSRRPDYLLRVRGMSMQGIGIMDGDLLAVHRTTDVHNGQVIVARLGDEVTVKRLDRRHGQIMLRAENPDYPDIAVPASESLAIEGLAVGLIRPDLTGGAGSQSTAWK